MIHGRHSARLDPASGVPAAAFVSFAVIWFRILAVFASPAEGIRQNLLGAGENFGDRLVSGVRLVSLFFEQGQGLHNGIVLNGEKDGFLI